jgi:hypothetical protein
VRPEGLGKFKNSSIPDYTNIIYQIQIYQSIYTRRSNNWSYMNSSTCKLSCIYCSTITTTTVSNRWTPQPYLNTKNNWASMILKIWISDFIKVEFDSCITPQDAQGKNIFRLLDTDNHTTLPINSFIRIIVTAAIIIVYWCCTWLFIAHKIIKGSSQCESALFRFFKQRVWRVFASGCNAV